VSSVPTSRPLPPEFSHPALQDLLRLGTTRGSVDAQAVRAACEHADVPMPRMKAVLRALDDAGVSVEVPAPPATRRAVAAASSRSSASTSASATAAGPASGAAIASPTKTAKPRPPAKKAVKKAADGVPAAGEAAPVKAAPVKAAAPAPTGDDVPDVPVDLADGAEDIADVDLALEDIEEVVVEVEVDPEVEVEAVAVVEGDTAEVKVEEEDAFVLSDDDDDAPAQQVATAGATADPVKDYLKQIGKVALLNAEQEVELAKRIEAGLFAEEQLNSGLKLDASCSGSPRTAAAPRTTCSRRTCGSSCRWPSATPAAACSSST